MVLYFTGTGNSEFVAQKIAQSLGDELLNIGERIKENSIGELYDEKRFVIVTPTYAWRIPRIVESFLKKTDFSGSKKLWFVMNCGGEIGNAEKYIASLCCEKGVDYMGVFPVVMPENYIAMFSVPDKEEARAITKKAVPLIESAAKTIKEGKKFLKPRNNLYDRLMSGPVNTLFYSLFVKADAFSADERCIGCGKCEKLCPLGNIKLKNKKPVWGKDCTHCMACICHCPTEAIEYGKKSVGKRRYRFEKP